MRSKRYIATGIAVAILAAASTAEAASPSTTGGATGAPSAQGSGSQSSGSPSPGDSNTQSDSGGAYYAPPPAGPSTPVHPIVQGFVAKVIHGVAYAPSYAPIQVQRAIWAGDRIRKKPYIFGGGHGAWAAAGYDCSGSVSYVLHAAGLLKSPFDSSQFMSWGDSGLGQWITVYTNPGHAFVQIAGIRLDTSALDDPHPPPGSGPRWRPVVASPPGFQARHPVGY